MSQINYSPSKSVRGFDRTYIRRLQVEDYLQVIDLDSQARLKTFNDLSASLQLPFPLWDSNGKELCIIDQILNFEIDCETKLLKKDYCDEDIQWKVTEASDLITDGRATCDTSDKSFSSPNLFSPLGVGGIYSPESENTLLDNSEEITKRRFFDKSSTVTTLHSSD